MSEDLGATVLIVDDETYVRESLAALLARRGCEVRTAGSTREALVDEMLDGLDVVVTDLKMPGEDGGELLRRLVDIAPGLPVVVLTGHGTVRSAVECLKAGAAEYLLKPVDPDELVLVLERTLGQAGLRREVELLRRGRDGALPALDPGLASGVGSGSGSDGGRAAGDGSGGGRPAAAPALPPGPLGQSEAWKRVLEMAETVAPTDTAILLLGESGTGKEEVAKHIHRLSRRADGPFVPVNCAAIPTDLFESEFFGHKRGAFTGALQDRVGRFKVAHRGTLLLDEVDSLPGPAQAKVLRVLQDGRFERVGDSRPTTSDVRLISATNSDLHAAVEAATFRADLYYRINVMTIHLPPLRERPEDVPILAEAFLRPVVAQVGKRIRGIEPDAIEALQSYRWPGNVRELRNVIERGVVLESTERLRRRSLPEEVRRADATGPPLDLRSSLLAEERRLLETALERAGGVRRRAAEMLGIDERNVSYFLKKHGLGNR